MKTHYVTEHNGGDYSVAGQKLVNDAVQEVTEASNALTKAREAVSEAEKAKAAGEGTAIANLKKAHEDAEQKAENSVSAALDEMKKVASDFEAYGESVSTGSITRSYRESLQTAVTAAKQLKDQRTSEKEEASKKKDDAEENDKVKSAAFAKLKSESKLVLYQNKLSEFTQTSLSAWIPIYDRTLLSVDAQSVIAKVADAKVVKITARDLANVQGLIEIIEAGRTNNEVGFSANVVIW